jgi:hypothetical protein
LIFGPAGAQWKLMYTITLLLLVLSTQPAFEKPACTAANHGRFWPEAANASPEAARRLSRCGALQMCIVVRHRYRWEPLSVHVSQAGRKHPEPAAACLAAQPGSPD